MTRTTSVSTALTRAALCVAIAAPVAACKDEKKDADATKTESPSGDADAPAGKSGEDDAKAPLADRLAGGIVEGMTPADKIQRGDALGHVLVPNPNRLLEEIRDQAAPSKFAATVNEAAIKTFGAMALGDKAPLIQHLDFGKPVGCMVLNATMTDVPVACTAGYQGGAAAFATDLGSAGKQADAGGHVAHYLIEGKDVFVDDLEGQIVITNHTEIFAKSKDYITTNMIGRAGKLATDIEIVAFLQAAGQRYDTQIQGALDEIARVSSVGKTGNKLVDAMMEYNEKSTRESLDRLREVEQITIGLGMEPVGFVGRFATFPVEGSRLQTEAVAAAAGPMQRKTVEAMPDNAFLVFGMNADWKKAWETESFVQVRDFMLETYADVTGHDAAKVKAAVQTYIATTKDIYGNEFAFAFAHEPGTVGGMVMSQSMQKPGREHYLEWSKVFTPELVLGTVGTDYVTWRFEEKVSEVDGIPVDRMTFEPGPKLAAEIKAELAKSPELAAIETRLGGFKLAIDRAESSDRVFYVVAPNAEAQYMKALMGAAKGDKSLAADKGIALVFDRNPSVSAVMAIDGKGLVGWLREILPPEKAAQIPADLGNDMSDAYMVSSYGASGSQTGEFVMGQPLIDQIRKLAE